MNKSDLTTKAIHYQKELLNNKTQYEIHFEKYLNDLDITFEFQKIIFVYKNGKLDTFFIADFYIEKSKLIIELDGGFHSKKRDSFKTKWLTKNGYNVLRFQNDDIYNESRTKEMIKYYL